LAYRMLFGKYSERNFPLKASYVTSSPLSSMMDLVLVHQCSASPVSMYTLKANLFFAGHVFASKILSRSFSHWFGASGLIFPLNFTGWCFRKSFRLHSLTGGRGFGPNTGAIALFSSSWRRASICYITACCSQSDTACRCIAASCCCIIAVLCCVMAATIASIALAISG